MNEQSLIKLSILLTSIFALIGILLGLSVGSDVIVFDGAFSTIGVILSAMSLAVAKAVNTDDADGRFPFGTSHLEPIFVFCKSIAVMGMCLYSVMDAIQALLVGGNEVSLGPAIVYGVLSVVACVGMMVLLRNRLRTAPTPLLRAEFNQWLGDALLSGGVLLGFIIAAYLRMTEFKAVVPFVDPLMVVICGCIFIYMPFKSFMTSVTEILGLRLSDEEIGQLNCVASEIADGFEAKHKLHVVKVGRRLDVELNLLVPGRSFTTDVMDRVRYQLAESASTIQERYWISVNFTADPKEL